MSQHAARDSVRRADIRFVLDGNRRGLAFLAAVALLTAFFETFLFAALAQAVASIARGRSTVGFDVGPLSFQSTTTTLLAAAFVAALIRAGLLVVVAYTGPRITAASRERDRQRLFSSYLQSDWTTQSTDKTGRLIQTMTSSVNDANSVINVLGQAMPALLTLLVMLAVAMSLNALITGSMVAIGVVLGTLLRPLRMKGRRSSRRDAAGRNATTSHVVGAVTAGAEVVTLGARRGVVAIANERIGLAERAYARGQTLNRLSPVFTQTSALLLASGGLLLLQVSGWNVEFATIGVITILLLRCAGLAQQVQTATIQFATVAPFIEQVRTLIDHYEQKRQRFGGRAFPPPGDIELRGVSYTYPGRDRVAIRVDLAVIEHGSAVAVLGPSGAGKSTLVQLLLRLRAPSAGVITIAGVPIDEITEEAFTSHVAYVPQAPHLVPGTIADNIRFFRDGISDAAVERAARAAHLHDEIAQLADGYDTVFDAHVDVLSGGQKQRLALARALVADPRVLVLDEPTSALDGDNEGRVVDTLKGLHGHTTVIAITHRPATVAHCDVVLDVVDGRLNLGRPTELFSS